MRTNLHQKQGKICEDKIVFLRQCYDEKIFYFYHNTFLEKKKCYIQYHKSISEKLFYALFLFFSFH